MRPSLESSIVVSFLTPVFEPMCIYLRQLALEGSYSAAARMSMAIAVLLAWATLSMGMNRLAFRSISPLLRIEQRRDINKIKSNLVTLGNDLARTSLSPGHLDQGRWSENHLHTTVSSTSGSVRRTGSQSATTISRCCAENRLRNAANFGSLNLHYLRAKGIRTSDRRLTARPIWAATAHRFSSLAK